LGLRGRFSEDKQGLCPRKGGANISSRMEQNRTSPGTNEFVANLLRNYLHDERDLPDFIRFENKILALTPEAISAAMRKYFDT
jgi:predicted Zn-dependent peptidase